MTVNNIPSCLRDLPDAILSALHNTGQAEVSFSRINPADLQDLWTLGVNDVDLENATMILTQQLSTALLSGEYNLPLEGIGIAEYQNEKSITITFVTSYPSARPLTIPLGLRPQHN